LFGIEKTKYNPMKAIEFKSKIKENKILIPRRMQLELATEVDKNVRVVVFVEDSGVYDEKSYRQMTKNQFLKGYADSDSVYDL
jgi:hypothetical protein